MPSPSPSPIDYFTFGFTDTPSPMWAAHIDRFDAMITLAELRCLPLRWYRDGVVVMYLRQHPRVPLEKTRAFRRLFGRV